MRYNDSPALESGCLEASGAFLLLGHNAAKTQYQDQIIRLRKFVAVTLYGSVPWNRNQPLEPRAPSVDSNAMANPWCARNGISAF